MYTLETSITVNGNKNLQSLEEFYQFDRSLSTDDIWHNFGIYCKHSISMNKMRDLKKELWNTSAQQYKLNLYFNSSEDAEKALSELKENGYWPGGTNSIFNSDDLSASESIYAVSPLQVAGAVTMTDNWFENPAVDINQ